MMRQPQSNQHENREIPLFEYMQQIIKGIPYQALIIDQSYTIRANNARQIEGTPDLLPPSDQKDTFSFRHCRFLTNKACNLASQCDQCLIHKTLHQVFEENQEHTFLTYLSENQNDDHAEVIEVKITINPITLKNEKFCILIVENQQIKSRQILIDRIFYHDILNLTNNLNQALDLISSEKKYNSELIYMIKRIAKNIEEEIIYQRNLAQSENDQYTCNPSPIQTSQIIDEIIEDHSMSQNENTSNHQIKKAPDFLKTEITSDWHILKRILKNMVKNALEASPEGKPVIIGCRQIKDNIIRFWVHNQSYIPENIQEQLFRHSFSTKGNNRGLGTYSMKILGEKTLKGRVNFTSDQERGTTFFIDLPLACQ